MIFLTLISILIETTAWLVLGTFLSLLTKVEFVSQLLLLLLKPINARRKLAWYEFLYWERCSRICGVANLLKIVEYPLVDFRLCGVGILTLLAGFSPAVAQTMSRMIIVRSCLYKHLGIHFELFSLLLGLPFMTNQCRLLIGQVIIIFRIYLIVQFCRIDVIVWPLYWLRFLLMQVRLDNMFGGRVINLQLHGCLLDCLVPLLHKLDQVLSLSGLNRHVTSLLSEACFTRCFEILTFC